ncbi:collagen alpha-1(III) chain-like [Panthera pardus]|uniref:Collagen alpha-1(III) chain-like n=1 Tax=Panthera pardus TaxID=9691 RepID=A0A9W2VSA5_PANPR|nr:collagen alpha-1(III) chain-like [Panthera pardus]
MEIYLWKRTRSPELPGLPELPARRTLGEPRGARSPRPAERRAGRCGRGGSAGRELIDGARGQVTRGATFPEPSPRWPPGPGRGRTGAERGGSLGTKLLGLRRRGPAAEGRGPGGAGALGRLLPGRAGPGVPGREPVSRGDGGAPPPSSASCAALQQRGRPAAAGEEAEEEPPERAARAQSCGVAFPRRRGAGSRSRPRAFSRSRLEPRGERCLLSPGSFLQTENSLVFGQLGAGAPVPARCSTELTLAHSPAIIDGPNTPRGARPARDAAAAAAAAGRQAARACGSWSRY